MSASSLFGGAPPQYSLSAAAGSEGYVLARGAGNEVSLVSPGTLEIGESLDFPLTFTETGGTGIYTVLCKAVSWNVPGGKYVTIRVGEGSAAFAGGGTELQSSAFPAALAPSTDTIAGLSNVNQGTTHRPACATVRSNASVLLRSAAGNISAGAGTVLAFSLGYFVVTAP